MRLRYIREPDAAKRMAPLQDMHRRLWDLYLSSTSSVRAAVSVAQQHLRRAALQRAGILDISKFVAETVTIFSGA